MKTLKNTNRHGKKHKQMKKGNTEIYKKIQKNMKKVQNKIKNNDEKLFYGIYVLNN